MQNKRNGCKKLLKEFKEEKNIYIWKMENNKTRVPENQKEK